MCQIQRANRRLRRQNFVVENRPRALGINVDVELGERRPIAKSLALIAMTS